MYMCYSPYPSWNPSSALPCLWGNMITSGYSSAAEYDIAGITVTRWSLRCMFWGWVRNEAICLLWFRCHIVMVQTISSLLSKMAEHESGVLVKFKHMIETRYIQECDDQRRERIIIKSNQQRFPKTQSWSLKSTKEIFSCGVRFSSGEKTVCICIC